MRMGCALRLTLAWGTIFGSLGLGACAADLEPALGQSQSALLGGQDTQGDPAVGLLRIPVERDLKCTVSAIYGRYALTARHCVQAQVKGKISPDGKLYNPGDMLIYFQPAPTDQDIAFGVLDYRYHRIDINHTQVHYEPDGSFRLVIASRDPGVPNWLETAGHTHGTMGLRWVKAREHPKPECRVVPIADLG